VLRRPKADLAVLGAYVAISFGYVGWEVLPHPGRYLIGGPTRDPGIFMWSFVWWPHAIASWTNPFVSHALYPPDGINLTWTATSPGLALAFTPLTLLAGSAVAYNVAAVLMPALSAWTAYLLCRHLTSSLWASAVGGYLFGFSSAILVDELWGDIDITGAFLVPLVALVVVRYVEGELDGRGLAWRLGLLLAGQLWISLELGFTITLFLAIGLLLAFALVPGARPRLRASLLPIAAGYALGAVFAAPFALYAIGGLPPGGFGTEPVIGSDLLSFVVPTSDVAIGGTDWAAARFHAGNGAYIGPPALLIVCLFARRARRSHWARFLLAAIGIAAVLTLGSSLQVAGRETIWMPLRLTAHLPAFEDLFPFRLAVYVALASAVIVAVWAATTKGWLAYVLPALAVLALAPAVWHPTFRANVRWKPDRPAFFAESLYKSCIPRGETVAIFPFGYRGDALLWQAEAGFRFSVAGDGLQQVTRGTEPWESFDADWAVSQLNSNELGWPDADSLLAFAALHHVDRFVSVASSGYPSAADMRRFGPVQQIGGVLVAPACGQPSLATRDLTSFVARYRSQQKASRPNVGWCVGTNFVTLPQGLVPVGAFHGGRKAWFVAGQGVTCAAPPDRYKRRGFAPASLGVPDGTYVHYAP
jgi:hypothetical protein